MNDLQLNSLQLTMKFRGQVKRNWSFKTTNIGGSFVSCLFCGREEIVRENYQPKNFKHNRHCMVGLLDDLIVQIKEDQQQIVPFVES